MFFTAILHSNSSIYPPKFVFFMAVFAYLLTLFLMFVLFCLNLIQNRLEGRNHSSPLLRTCCWTDPTSPGPWVPITLVFMDAACYGVPKQQFIYVFHSGTDRTSLSIFAKLQKWKEKFKKMVVSLSLLSRKANGLLLSISICNCYEDI